jgi:predicted small secreted protein
MKRAKIRSGVGLLLAALLLVGIASAVTACNTVAGAGQDVSAVGNTVTTGATATKRALP